MPVSLNPVISSLGRRLRLALIGGGPGAFIGAAHRQAARIDDYFEIVAASLSTDPGRAQQAGLDIGLPPAQCYASGEALIAAQSTAPVPADVVAIMTPNDSHFRYAMAALTAGMDVICDKPMCNSVADANTLQQAVQDSGRIFCLTHNYSGYPLVRQARAMVMDGQLGEIRLVQVEYVQGGRAVAGPGRAAWKNDPGRSGPSLVLGDIGTHAHQLLRFVTGREVVQVAAEVGTIVPGSATDDYAVANLRLDNGARGSFWVTQAAGGVENCLRLRVSGALGTLEWQQEQPQQLIFRPLGAPVQIRTPNGPGTLPLAQRASRIVAGHPEGFHEGFANLYSDFAQVIVARRMGQAPDPLTLHFPNAQDGWLGVRFVDAMLRSSREAGAWTSV